MNTKWWRETRSNLKIAPGPSDPQIQFAPLPSAVDSVAIDPTLGYFVGNLGGGVYWVMDGSYNFMVSTHGVIVVDCYMPLATRRASPSPHLVYSHLHADHIGGASLFNASHPTIIAHAETRNRLATLSPARPTVPAADITFEGDYNRVCRHQTLKLSYHVPQPHAEKPLMYAPAQCVAVLIDVIFPAGRPSQSSG
ncbi:hypothetical protein B0H14DRAFT_3435813 [Mycena olivaceomarginata]|nr:hypothetical protein B0H14DRAFT_3435813 [Mycena olivaceomarginata]